MMSTRSPYLIALQLVLLFCGFVCRAQAQEPVQPRVGSTPVVAPAGVDPARPQAGNNPTAPLGNDDPGTPQPLARMCVYKGDTIPYVKLPTLYVFRPVRFKNKRQKKQYDKLVRDVKKVLPLAKEVRMIVIETYQYLQTIPDKKGRDRHIKAVERDLKARYTPRLKKLTLSQGKLLIKLVDRETRSTGYELVRAFMGSLKATFYQTFAALFGASLKKEYDPLGDDILVEQVVLMVESGQL